MQRAEGGGKASKSSSESVRSVNKPNRKKNSSREAQGGQNSSREANEGVSKGNSSGRKTNGGVRVRTGSSRQGQSGVGNGKDSSRKAQKEGEGNDSGRRPKNSRYNGDSSSNKSEGTSSQKPIAKRKKSISDSDTDESGEDDNEEGRNRTEGQRMEVEGAVGNGREVQVSEEVDEQEGDDGQDDREGEEEGDDQEGDGSEIEEEGGPDDQGGEGDREEGDDGRDNDKEEEKEEYAGEQDEDEGEEEEVEDEEDDEEKEEDDEEEEKDDEEEEEEYRGGGEFKGDVAVVRTTTKGKGRAKPLGGATSAGATVGMRDKPKVGGRRKPKAGWRSKGGDQSPSSSDSDSSVSTPSTGYRDAASTPPAPPRPLEPLRPFWPSTGCNNPGMILELVKPVTPGGVPAYKPFKAIGPGNDEISGVSHPHHLVQKFMVEQLQKYRPGGMSDEMYRQTLVGAAYAMIATSFPSYYPTFLRSWHSKRGYHSGSQPPPGFGTSVEDLEIDRLLAFVEGIPPFPANIVALFTNNDDEDTTAGVHQPNGPVADACVLGPEAVELAEGITEIRLVRGTVLDVEFVKHQSGEENDQICSDGEVYKSIGIMSGLQFAMGWPSEQGPLYPYVFGV
jgi:hypothetical protein